jgi:hypothetical protein
MVDEWRAEHPEGIPRDAPAFPSGGRAGRTGCPPWTHRREALGLFLSGVTVRAAAPVALVVGSVLSAVNQGGVLLQGRLHIGLVVKIVVNYLTPFVVASLGYLAAGRRPPR